MFHLYHFSHVSVLFQVPISYSLYNVCAKAVSVSQRYKVNKTKKTYCCVTPFWVSFFFTMSRYNDRDAHLQVSGWEMNE